MLRSCPYCGRVHDSRHDCGKRPVKRFRRTETERIRYTSAMARKSAEIKERSHYLCAVCLDAGVLTYDGLETHHIRKLRERPDLALVDGNLICLCGNCHERAERGDISAERLERLAAERDRVPPGG